MSKQEIMTAMAAILTTLAETDRAPESQLYIFLNQDMRKWEIVKACLDHGKFIKTSGHYVTLTKDGLEAAAKIEEAMKK